MTYDEYFNAVADKLEKLLARQNGINGRQDVVKYMKSEEDCIKSKYKINKKDYDDGKFPASVWEGCVNSVAYCLYMLYE